MRKGTYLLGVETDDEGWDVDDLLSDADVALADEHARVVDRLCAIKGSDLALLMSMRTYRPSLKTCVCRRRSKKSSI